MNLSKTKLGKAVSIFGMFAIVVASFAFALTTAKAAEYDYAWVSQSDYPTLAPGEVKTLNLAIKNTGTATWYNTGDHAINLGTIRPTDRNSGFAKDWINTHRAVTMNEASVTPGGTGTFSFQIVGNPAAGTYPEYFAPVVENLTWMADKGIYWNITVAPGGSTSGYNAELVSKSANPTVAAGDIADLNVVVKNTGTATWSNSAPYPIHLATWSPENRSSDFFDTTWLSPNRPANLVESSVAPNAQGTFNFKVHVPTGKASSAYTETFNLVAENMNGGWFNLPISFTINVAGTSTGDVTVSLASDTPTGVTLPKGATAVEMAKFKFVGTGTVSSLKLHRYGVGDANAFENVYLYEGDHRLTNGRSVSSSSHIAEFSSLNWQVSGTKYLTVVADLSATGTGQHGFEIVSSSDVSLASVGGNFPIKGELFAIGDSTASQVTINAQSNPADPNVGEHAELAKFKINAGSNDIAIHRITLLQAGTISNSDLTNLELYQGSTKIASVDNVNGDKIDFVPSSPFNMTNGTNRIFTVKGTTAGRADRTVKLYAEYTADMMIEDQIYGVGSQINNQYDGTAGFSIVTLQGGNVTISYNGPTTGDITKNGQDQVMLNFAISSASRQIEVKKIEVRLDGIGANLDDTGTDLFTDIKIRETDSAYTASVQSVGSTLMGPKSLCTGSPIATCPLSFTDSFYVDGGTTKYLQITWDVANNDYFNTDRVYTATVNAWTSNSIRYTDTGEYLSTADIVPATAFTGNQQTVKSSSLNVTLAGDATSDTVVTNQTGVNAVAFNFTAGSSAVTLDSVKLHSLIDENPFTGYSSTGIEGTTYVKNVVTSTKLMADGSQIGTSQNISTDGIVTFNSLNLNIPANSSKTVYVNVNIGSLAPYVNPSNAFALYINASGDVTGTDINGDSVTVALTNGNSTPSIYQTVIQKGDISVVQDGGTPTGAVILSSTSKVEVAKFRFTAVREAMKIEKLGFSIGAANSDNVAVSQVYINGGSSDIAASSSDLSASGANYAKFEGLNIVVPKDGTLTISVLVDLKSMDVAGTYSGKQIQVAIDDEANYVFRAVGSASGAVRTTFSNHVAGAEAYGKTMVVHKSKPTLTKVAISNSQLTSGTKEVYRFTVSADSKGAIDLGRVTLDYALNGAGLTAGTWRMYDVTSGKTLVASGSPAANRVFFYYDMDPSITYVEIGAGSTKTFTIECNIGGTIATGYSLDVFMANDGAYSANSTWSALAPATHALLWSDESIIPHDYLPAPTTADFTNGYLINNLPLDHQVISYNA